MRTLLRTNGEFRRLFMAHSVSRTGDAFNTVALVVLVFDLTGTGLGVAGAVMFEVVDEDDLVTANSAMWTTSVTAQIALAPLAGFVIAAWGIEVAFAVNAATFALSALLLIGLRPGGHQPTSPSGAGPGSSPACRPCEPTRC